MDTMPQEHIGEYIPPSEEGIIKNREDLAQIIKLKIEALLELGAEIGQAERVAELLSLDTINFLQSSIFGIPRDKLFTIDHFLSPEQMETIGKEALADPNMTIKKIKMLSQYHPDQIKSMSPEEMMRR